MSSAVLYFFKFLGKDSTKIESPAGQRVGDAVKAAGGNEDACVYLVAGRDMGKDYILKAGDVVMARQLPKGIGVALAITAAAVVVGLAAGTAIKKYAEYKINKALKNATVTNKSTDTTYDEAPWLRGASNQVATGRTFPYIIGKTYFAPYKLCGAHMTFTDGTYAGANQFYNTVLECGFNYLTVKEVCLKNTTIADWSDTTEPQGMGDDVASTTSDTLTMSEGATYYDSENAMEVRQDGDFVDLEQFNIKKVWTDAGSEIPHDYDDDTDEGDDDSTWDAGISIECPGNTASVEAWVEFPTLRYYDDDGEWQSASVTLEAAWSNDGGESWNAGSSWAEDAEVVEDSLSFYSYGATIAAAVTNCTSYKWASYEYVKNTSVYMGDSKAYSTVTGYLLNDYSTGVTVSDYTAAGYTYTYTQVTTSLANVYRYQPANDIGYVGGGTSYIWKISLVKYADVDNTSGNLTVSGNRSSVSRYSFYRAFTYAEAYGKTITVRIRRTSAKYENDQTSVYFLGVNTQHYDDTDEIEDLGDDGLLTAQLAAPLESRLANKCTRLGIVMKSTDNTSGSLDYFNVIVQGVARVWDSDSAAWTSSKQETSNLAAWCLEILTSDQHTPSKYDDSELDLDSFGAWYEYCDAMGFEANGAISDDAKKSDILETLLSNGHATLYMDEFTGKLAVAYDGFSSDEELEASYNVAILNSDNIISMESTREYSRKADGLRVSYVDAAANYETNTFILMGETDDDGYPRDYDSETDTLEDLSLSYVTTYEHAYRLAWRKLAEQKASPRTVTVNVSAEGAYYPLYSRVLLQHKALAVGLGYGRIVAVTYSGNTGKLYSITLASPATKLDTSSTYGVIINCQSASHRGVLSFTVRRGTDARVLYIRSGSIYADDELAPEVGDTVSYGELDSDGDFTLISAPMKVVNITPSGTGYTLTLQDFNEDVYKYATMPTYRSNVTASGNSVSAAAAVEIAKAAASSAQSVQTTVSTLQSTSTTTETLAAASEVTADEVAGMASRGVHYTEVTCLSEDMQEQLEASNLELLQKQLDNAHKDAMVAAELARDDVDALKTGTDAFLKLVCTGKVLLTGLPTEEPATAGQLWNDGGTLKIATGDS